MRVAGIMSGTSLDGIDVAVIDIGRRISTLAHHTTPYSSSLRRRILAAQTPQQISRLNFELGDLYAKAVEQAAVPLNSIELIGCHGQTIYHEGSGRAPSTLQIGEADVIAERLGIPVVSQFRTRDMAAGGKGAPLVPFVDNLLFRHPKLHRVALNIGGIANITVLPPAGPAIAFDTGPGNMIIDQLVERITDGKQRFDRGGRIAAQGHVDRKLLNTLLRHSYFRAKPPKTAGREQYGVEFLSCLPALPPADLIATVTAFTAASIAQSIARFAPQTTEVIAAGGGVHNAQLMGQLAALLTQCRVTTTAEFGVDPDAKEAIAFAVLAHRTWNRRTGNLPSATGARHEVVLGKISPGK